MSTRRTVTLTIADGEYSPLPNTNKHVLMGPGTVEVTRYGDGRLDGRIVEGQSGLAERAIKLQLKRVVWEV